MLQPGKFYQLREEFCHCEEGVDEKGNRIYNLVNAAGRTISTCKVDGTVPGIRQVSQAAYEWGTTPREEEAKEDNEAQAQKVEESEKEEVVEELPLRKRNKHK